MTASPSFARRLVSWFEGARRDLPWRRDRDPYRVVVSELMLQQTTVASAIPHFERFVLRFPGWTSLARASESDVLAAWAGLGYYRRARNLHALAQVIAARGGEFPRSLEGALELPGVGPYTAGAVLSLAHGLPVPAVDGNVARVLSRHRGRPWRATSAADRRELEREVLALQPPDAPGPFNEALMELGATTCTPRQPRCGTCPVASDCVALLTDRVATLPPPPARPASREVLAGAAVIERDGCLLLRRRPADAALLAGLWELPGGFVEGPDVRAWLVDEVLASLGGGEALERLGSVRHVITTRRITLEAWRCRLARRPAAGPDLAWVPPADAEDLGITAGTRKLIQFLSNDITPARPARRRPRT